jgi:hypothetical protein
MSRRPGPEPAGHRQGPSPWRDTRRNPGAQDRAWRCQAGRRGAEQRSVTTRFRACRRRVLRALSRPLADRVACRSERDRRTRGTGQGTAQHPDHSGAGEARPAGCAEQSLPVHPAMLTYGAIGGIIRRKDAVKVAALASALDTGAAASLFTEQDRAVFAAFTAEHDRRYPRHRARQAPASDGTRRDRRRHGAELPLLPTRVLRLRRSRSGPDPRRGRRAPARSRVQPQHGHPAVLAVLVPRQVPRFRGRFPASPALTRAYLRHPVLWRMLGKQFLVIGANPG